MNYENFLFSQLFMIHVENNETRYKELEYDLIYPEVIAHQEFFLKSKHNIDSESEYDCILNYLEDNLPNRISSNGKIRFQIDLDSNLVKKVIVKDLEGLDKDTISKIENPMIYLGEYEESGDVFADLRNSNNEPIRIFHERVKDA